MNQYEELEKLSDLKDKWILSKDEFQHEKEKILSHMHNEDQIIEIENNENTEEKSSEETKTCPYCAEQIDINATTCPYCWEELSDSNKDNVLDNNNNLNYEYKSFSDINFLFSANWRINRLQFILWLFLYLIFAFCLRLLLSIIAIIFNINIDNLDEWMYHVILIPDYYFLVTLYIRRFHDLNKPGWYTLWMIIPFYNIYLLILLFFFKGKNNNNNYKLN